MGCAARAVFERDGREEVRAHHNGALARYRPPPGVAGIFAADARQSCSRVPASSRQAAETKAVLFADVYTNYGLPERGLAALRTLRALVSTLS